VIGSTVFCPGRGMSPDPSFPNNTFLGHVDAHLESSLNYTSHHYFTSISSIDVDPQHIIDALDASRFRPYQTVSVTASTKQNKLPVLEYFCNSLKKLNVRQAYFELFRVHFMQLIASYPQSP
jgi:hypothetical protein